MAKLGMHEIRALAKDIISQTPGGIRYAELLDHVHRDHPETLRTTINAAIWDLAARFPAEVGKPSRGLYKAATDTAGGEITEPLTQEEPLQETTFHQPFAEYLKNNLDEVIVARPLGGASLQKKWSTPDVVRVYKPLASDLTRFEARVRAQRYPLTCSISTSSRSGSKGSIARCSMNSSAEEQSP